MVCFSIRLRYGAVWGDNHNGSGGSKARVEFNDGERITSVEMDKRNHWGAEVRNHMMKLQL